MEDAHNDPAGEITRLQRSINDLVSVFALSALWNTGDPPQILSTSLDALLRMLSLEFVYARANDPVRESPIEMLRLARSTQQEHRLKEFCEAFRQRFGDDSQN